jgi:hypothetical protein
MAFDVTGLDAYVEENKPDLGAAVVLGAKMMQHATVMPGVKGDVKLPNVANTIFFQTGGSCGFNASGSSTFSQRTLSPGKVKVDMEWCPKDLESIYLSSQIRAGAYYDSVEPSDVWAMILENVTNEIAAAVDVSIWQGDTSTGTGNNQFFNGFIDTIGSGGIDANTTSIYSGTALTDINLHSQALEAQHRLYTALSNNGISGSDITSFIGYDAYAALVSALINGGSTYGSLINSGLGGADPAADLSQGLTFPGNNMSVVPVQGLTGTGDAYAGKTSNMFIGVDGIGDETNLNVWYSQDNDTVRMKCEFKVGTQVRFPGEIANIIL